MKKYIGTKQIEAEPMDSAQAYNHGYNRNVQDVIDGYHVIYINPDGTRYHSWSPKDVFEKAYKVADTFKDRLVIEQKDLAEKLTKLCTLTDGSKFEKTVTDANQRELLLKQRDFMSEYLNILNQRIESLQS